MVVQRRGYVDAVKLFPFQFILSAGLPAIARLLSAEYAPQAMRTRSAALITAFNCVACHSPELTPSLVPYLNFHAVLYHPMSLLRNHLRLHPEAHNISLRQADELFTGGESMLHRQPSMGDAGGGPYPDNPGLVVYLIRKQTLE